MKHLVAISLIAASMCTAMGQESTSRKDTDVGITVNEVINTLKDRIELSGYGQFGYTYNSAEDPDNEFDVKRIILMADGKITDRWRVYFMYSINKNSSLQELYTDYTFCPEFSLRLGQFKVPYTIESPISARLVELINSYSQATNYLAGISGSDPLYGAKSGRDLGFMAFGNLFNSYLTYNIGVFNGQGINTSDKNSNKDLVGSLMINPLKWLSVGGSVIKGKGHAIANSVYNPEVTEGMNYRRDRWAGGVLVKTAPLNLRAEYLGGKDGKVKSEGYYATTEIHVLPKFDVVASYDFFNYNKTLQMKQTNYVAGVQYWFYPKCRLQAQYTFSDKKFEKNAHVIQTQIQIAF